MFLALEVASPRNRRCASCIGTLSFPMVSLLGAAVAKPGIGGGVMIPRAAHTSPPHFVFVSVYDDTTLNSYHTDVHTACK